MAAITSVGAYVPVQRVQAERAAAQAEGRAQRLAAESAQARSQANQLNQRAERLRQASGQAQQEANQARRSGDDVPAVAQVGRATTASVPVALRAPDPANEGARVSAPSSVAERVAFINRYRQVGGAAQASGFLNVDA